MHNINIILENNLDTYKYMLSCALQDELKRFVRFWSSKSGDNQTSLDEYIGRMKAAESE